MAREVNVNFSKPVATGSNVSVPQYTMNVTFAWIDNVGVAHSDTRTVLFPNVLAQIPPARLLELVRDLIMERARTVAAVDA